MRFFGEGRRGALSPVEKPRDAEAMDAGVAVSVDDQVEQNRADAGVKTKLASGLPAGADKKTGV